MPVACATLQAPLAMCVRVRPKAVRCFEDRRALRTADRLRHVHIPDAIEEREWKFGSDGCPDRVLKATILTQLFILFFLSQTKVFKSFQIENERL